MDLSARRASVRAAVALVLGLWGCGDDSIRDSTPPAPNPNATLNCPQGLVQLGGRCVDQDECEEGLDTCGPGVCTNTVGSFTCVCEDNWDWNPIEYACVPQPCEEEGYERLTDVCTDIDECAPEDNICVTGGATCVNEPGSYTCECPPGGTWVEDRCAFPPCPEGFLRVGADCLDVDECDLGDPCPASGLCVNIAGSFACDCGGGGYWDHEACLEIPCPEGMARTEAGCVDIDECAGQAEVCSAGGASCVNSDPGWACDCGPGADWEGDACVERGCPKGYARVGGVCEDLDECAAFESAGEADPCASGGGSCANTVGGYECACAEGEIWDGAACATQGCPAGWIEDEGACKDIDECLDGTAVCPDGVDCVNTDGGFLCDCPEGYLWDGEVCFDVEDCGSEAAASCEAVCIESQGTWACISSVRDTDSPWWDAACPGFVADKTDLLADCRCGDNRQSIPRCGAVADAPAAGVGKGPSARVAGARLTGGVVDPETRELFVGTSYGDTIDAKTGFVLGVDLATGDRRVVSGTYKSPDGDAEFGSGEPIAGGVFDVELGPDGQLYAYVQVDTAWRMEILRIDPETGARALVWRGNDTSFGQCAPGDVGISGAEGAKTTREGFAVGPDGRFYVSFYAPLRDGIGVVAIAPDGQACEYLTISGDRLDGLAAGSGEPLEGPLRGLRVREGALYGIDAYKGSLVRVYLDTGARSLAAPYAMGTRWVQWDEAGGRYLTAGLAGESLVGFVDASTAQTEPVTGYGPFLSGTLGLGGVWLDPGEADRIILAHDEVGLVALELDTGNAIILSL